MSYNVEATVDGIKIHYDGGEVEVDYNASDGDVVRLTIEPLEVKVTDGFRAAVKKACNCDSSSGGGSGGSTGGGVLVVHAIEIEGTKTATKSQKPSDGGNPQIRLDKTWQEIHDADAAFMCFEFTSDEGFTVSQRDPVLNVASNGVIYNVESGLGNFSASSPNEYPVRGDQDK